MKKTDLRQARSARMLRRVGALVERFRLDTRTTFEILNRDTGMHYRTYRKLTSGHPGLKAAYLLEALAELMRRDRINGTCLTGQFMADLRGLLEEYQD